MRFFLLFAALILAAGCASDKDSYCGVYQGIIPGADGPGIEVTLYLYPEGRGYSKEVYLKNPDIALYDYPRWVLAGEIIEVAFSGNTVYRFRAEKNRAYLLDAENKPLPTGAFLYRK